MVRYPPCPNLPPGVARHQWVCTRFCPPKSAQVYQPLGRKEALTMPTSPSAKQLVLSTTALCGELSVLAASRLVPSQSYRYHVLEELGKDKLLRAYRRDQVKGYRLTRRAKTLLTEQAPARYAALFTGSVRTNSYASELSRRLRMHRLGEVLAMMQLGGVSVCKDDKADLFGSRISPPGEPPLAFYPAREIQALGDAAIKIKNARMAGVLLTPARFYLVYNTGSARMRWAPASELRARTLLTEFLGRRMGWPAYAGQNAEALLLAEDLSLAPTLLTNHGGGKRQLFYLDSTYEHLYLLPNTAQGDLLLQFFLFPRAFPSLHAAIGRTFLPKQQLGNFAFDALDEKGRPVLFAWDFDLVRIQSFQLGIRSRGLSGVAVAFDVQAPALQQCLGSAVEIRPLSLARTGRMLLGG